MYYYPYYLQLVNLWSFRHHNTINETDINTLDYKTTQLWSISRWSYPRYKGYKTFTASYNHLTKNYEFNDKRYISYDDLVKDALTL